MPDTHPVKPVPTAAERRLVEAVGKINNAVDDMPYIDLQDPASWTRFRDGLIVLLYVFREAQTGVAPEFERIAKALQ